MSGKVLILETLGADYGAYFTTRGFTELLGAENVRMWPYKHTNERGHDSYPERYLSNGQVLQIKSGKIDYGNNFSFNELWNNKLFWRFWKTEKNIGGTQLPSDGPVNHVVPLGIPKASDDEIFEMIHNNEFELIVLNGARWHGAAALHELRETFGDSLPPVVMCDHDDYTTRRADFIDAFRPLLYFKRSFIRGGHVADWTMGFRNTQIRPFSFSSMWDTGWTPWKERDIDVFCIFGATQVMRQKLKEVTLEICANYPNLRIMTAVGHPMGHEEYIKTLSRSKIVIDQQSYGTDTLRFWEAASAGCCLVSDFNVHTPAEEILPETHFYKYDNDCSPRGDQQNFVRFRAELKSAIENDQEAESRARRLYDNVRQHHTNAAHAKYIVNELTRIGKTMTRLQMRK